MRIDSEKLKRTRELKGFSLRELANRTGIAIATLNKWETLDSARPFASKVKIVADALEIRMDELCIDEDQTYNDATPVLHNNKNQNLALAQENNIHIDARRSMIMEINLMSWNTELYIYGTRDKNGKIIKPFENAPANEIIQIVNNFICSKENPIVVLQEIPFKRKNENYKWERNEHFNSVKKFVEENGFEMFCLDSDEEYHIKMTVIIAKKGFLEEARSIKKSNKFVPVKIKKTNLEILGVHSDNAFELHEWIKQQKIYNPSIIIGDFNSGNYVKSQNDENIAVNRANYQMLTAGYIDACQGRYTTRYKEPTQIDHIHIKNSFEFNNRYTLKDAGVDDTITYSDHYPIYCTLEVTAQ